MRQNKYRFLKGLVPAMAALMLSSMAWSEIKPGEEPEFGNRLTAFNYWIGTKGSLLSAKTYKIREGIDHFDSLHTRALHLILNDPQNPWRVYRVANYNPMAQDMESPIGYEDLVFNNQGASKRVLSAGYYFIYRASPKGLEHLIVHPTNAYEYDYTERSYFSYDIIEISHGEGQDQLMRDFIGELNSRFVFGSENPFRGSAIEFVGQDIGNNSSFRLRFMKNVGGLNMKWDELILPAELKANAFDSTEGFINNLSDFSRFNLKAKKGVLLEGPPGTGKSLLGQVLISSMLNKRFVGEVQPTFIALTARHLMYKHSVRSLFEAAAQLAPAIIFMEDVDLLGTTSRSETDYMSKSGQPEILNEFLNGIDGVVDNKGVLVIATTNRADSVDSALLRSERLGTHLYFGNPSFEERKEFFERFGKKRALWEESLSVEELSGRAEGYSGADIVELISLAKQEAWLQKSFKNEVLFLKREHFDRAFTLIQQSKISGVIETPK